MNNVNDENFVIVDFNVNITVDENELIIWEFISNKIILLIDCFIIILTISCPYLFYMSNESNECILMIKMVTSDQNMFHL